MWQSFTVIYTVVTKINDVQLYLFIFKDVYSIGGFPGGSDGKGQGSLVCCSPWGRKETGLGD